MAKPSQADKDRVKTEADKVKNKLQGEGHVIQACDLTDADVEDTVVFIEVQIPGHPGKFFRFETPMLAKPNSRGEREKAEDYIKRNQFEQHVRDILGKYERGKPVP